MSPDYSVMAQKRADLSREHDFSDKQADGVVTVVNDSILMLDKRFNDVDRRLDDVDRRLDDVDRRLDDVERHVNAVDNRIIDVESNINKRFDKLENKFWFTIAATAGSAVVTTVAVMSDLTTIVGFFSG